MIRYNARPNRNCNACHCTGNGATENADCEANARPETGGKAAADHLVACVDGWDDVLGGIAQRKSSRPREGGPAIAGVDSIAVQGSARLVLRSAKVVRLHDGPLGLVHRHR
jgi:hypothetical protein